MAKKTKWLRWRSGETKSNKLKKVRQGTDQRLRRQGAKNDQPDEAEKKNPSSRS
jgi:hypothetical protein